MQYWKMTTAAALLSFLVGIAPAQDTKTAPDETEKAADDTAVNVDPAAPDAMATITYAAGNPVYLNAVRPLTQFSYVTVDDTLVPFVDNMIYSTAAYTDGTGQYSLLHPNPTTALNPSGVGLQMLADGTIGAVYQDGQQLPAGCVVDNGATLDVLSADGNVTLALSTTADGGYLIPPGCYATIVPSLQCPPKIGVNVVPLDPALAKHLGLDPECAIVVAEVEAGGPAEQAGIEQYDVIVEVNGQSPVSADSLRASVAATAVGSEITLEVQRGMQRIEVSVCTTSAARGAVFPDYSKFRDLKVAPSGVTGTWNPIYVPTILPDVASPQNGIWSPLSTGGSIQIPTTAAPDAEPQTVEQRVAELEAKIAEVLAQQEALMKKLGAKELN